MQQAAIDSAPLAIYYAFKQAEVDAEGISSTGWAGSMYLT
jgi:putative DNA methylase